MASPVARPEGFPADLPLPAEYLIESVETSPSLVIVGRVRLPVDPAGARLPIEQLKFEMLQSMDPSWTLVASHQGEFDYTFTHTDGREGRFFVLGIAGCPEYATITYELPWVTP